jgi:ATP-dependent RNA helicase DDX47/RRP3
MSSSAMSTKRRKVSHGDGAIKEASAPVPKPKSKTQSAPKPTEPSPPPTSSDAESATIDDVPGEGSGNSAPKSFKDLVCNVD